MDFQVYRSFPQSELLLTKYNENVVKRFDQISHKKSKYRYRFDCKVGKFESSAQ